MPKQVINYDIMFYMFILLYMLLEDEYPNHLFLLQYRYIDLKYYHGLGEEEGFARQLQGLVELRDHLLRQGDQVAQRSIDNINSILNRKQ